MPDLATLLAPERLVDLTQPLGPSTPLWPGSTPITATTVVDYETHGGYARDVCLPEHAGTHLDAPAHIWPEGATVEAVPLATLVCPAVKLDVRELVDGNPAYALPAAEIALLEQRDGAIPAGAAVLVQTGWDAHLGDPVRYGAADPPAFPGLAADAAELLVARGVAGVGIDTLGIDPGDAAGLPAHRITLPAGLWHLEGLVGLERVPARGAWLVVAPLPLVGGSGAPARVLAVLPA